MDCHEVAFNHDPARLLVHSPPGHRCQQHERSGELVCVPVLQLLGLDRHFLRDPDLLWP